MVFMETAASPPLLAPLQEVSPPHHLTECRENLKPRVSLPERVLPTTTGCPVPCRIGRATLYYTTWRPKKLALPNGFSAACATKRGTTQSAGRAAPAQVVI